MDAMGYRSDFGNTVPLLKKCNLQVSEQKQAALVAQQCVVRACPKHARFWIRSVRPPMLIPFHTIQPALLYCDLFTNECGVISNAPVPPYKNTSGVT
ncbi:hypothetical protein TNCV_2274701 [Trichonephila clavipes]|nr:hypothetical protein TNCV_2274701 [Trichonephila clavipes]